MDTRAYTRSEWAYSENDCLFFCTDHLETLSQNASLAGAGPRVVGLGLLDIIDSLVGKIAECSNKDD